MNIAPITNKNPACFGVMCPNHGQCARYHMVDGKPAGQTVIGTCERDGARPLFLLKEKS